MNPPIPLLPCCRCGALTDAYQFAGGNVCGACFTAAHVLKPKGFPHESPQFGERGWGLRS